MIHAQDARATLSKKSLLTLPPDEEASARFIVNRGATVQCRSLDRSGKEETPERSAGLPGADFLRGIARHLQVFLEHGQRLSTAVLAAGSNDY